MASTPGTGWSEEWEISDLDEPAKRVSTIEGADRLSGALVRVIIGLSFILLWVALMLDKLSGGQFTVCFVALTVVSGGTALIKHPQYLNQLGRLSRDEARAVSTMEGLGAQSKSDSGDDPSEGEGCSK